MQAAEREFSNSTVVETLIRGVEDSQIHIHSIVLYLQGESPDDQISAIVEFPGGGGGTQIAMIQQWNLGGGTLNHDLSVYPNITLPPGASLAVSGIVTGVGNWAGIYVIYDRIPVMSDADREIPAASAAPASWGFGAIRIPGIRI